LSIGGKHFMSASQRQILADYLRPLRPLRPLRMMRSLVQAATYFTGEAAIPFFLAELLPASLTTALCFVHDSSWLAFPRIVPLTTPSVVFNPSLAICQAGGRFPSFQLLCVCPRLVSFGWHDCLCSHYPTCFKSGLPSALGGGAAG
jgi:hypothetical protein